MNSYRIQHRIKTVADLMVFSKNTHEPGFNFGNIRYTPWKYSLADGPSGDAWLAEGSLEAESYRAAIWDFRKELSSQVPRIAFISQCYMDFSSDSFIVMRNEENEEGIFYTHYVFGSSPGLVFSDDEVEDLGKLVGNKEFFWYMNDCYNNSGYTAKILLLCAALENLAGKRIVTKEGSIYETYNASVMKKILGKQVFNTLYGQRGIRHKLSHGDYIDSSLSGEDWVEKIHKLIIGYFNETYGTKISLNVVSPQRGFSDRAYFTNAFMKPIEQGMQGDLRTLESDFIQSKKDINNLKNFKAVFDKRLDEGY